MAGSDYPLYCSGKIGNLDLIKCNDGLEKCHIASSGPEAPTTYQQRVKVVKNRVLPHELIEFRPRSKMNQSRLEIATGSPLLLSSLPVGHWRVCTEGRAAP